MKFIPNLLSSGRLVLTLFMFLALAAVGGGVPFLRLGADSHQALMNFAFWAFVIAAVTDFFDGWLARKLDAVTVWGAILDPIGDKVLVCGAILGLLALGPQPMVVVPSGLILFREFTVSALREVGAGKGIKLPVTMLAKWKTTCQLIALGAELCLAAGQVSNPSAPGFDALAVFAHGALWGATLITLVTGIQYWDQTRRALKA